MGQRLNIEIWNEGKRLANAYYHWSGYSFSTLYETMKIIKARENNMDKVYELDAIHLLEVTGAGLSDNSLKIATKKYPDEHFKACTGRNNGLLAIDEKDMDEIRRWGEARSEIHFDTETIILDTFYTVDEDGEYIDSCVIEIKFSDLKGLIELCIKAMNNRTYKIDWKALKLGMTE